MAKPILKWAGGKNVILKLIKERLDKIENKNVKFYDVFAGAGSVTFEFCKDFNECIINDANKELINVYIALKTNHKKLCQILDKHINNHNHDYYYKVRAIDRTNEYKNMDMIERAARTIYLNKTCYNGLYRVNRKNEFNVPIGRQKNISVYNNNNIIEVVELLKKISIYNKDYSVVLKQCKPGDVVYIDPPYDKINEKSFIEYNALRFNEFDQERLKTDIDLLTEKGVYVIASNSYTENIKNLYNDYIKEGDIIKVKRSIASKNSSREPIEEILIDNIERVKKNVDKS
jgi:DNA adenine methylase